MALSKGEEFKYEKLRERINQWNKDHIEMFEISLPSEKDLQFHGVVRFFFKDVCEANVISKCVHMSSHDTAHEVVKSLLEKLPVDLSPNNYALYVIHPTGDEMRLADNEHPLSVQLEWPTDVTEPRFLLKKEDVSK